MRRSAPRPSPRGQGPCPRGLHRHPHVYDARHDDASRLATMGCRICLDAYTPDERPAALPCGHVFHHACLQDWLTTRTHGAVPSGCPLCKAPAALTDLVPLWASDTDLKQYVAAHPPDGRLSSMHAWVRHLHDYAIATHLSLIHI